MSRSLKRATQRSPLAPAVSPKELSPQALLAAASAGDPRAQYKLARWLADGCSAHTPDLFQAAHYWLTEAANRGYVPAQCTLGSWHEQRGRNSSGSEREQELLEACKWFQAAAAQAGQTARTVSPSFAALTDLRSSGRTNALARRVVCKEQRLVGSSPHGVLGSVRLNPARATVEEELMACKEERSLGRSKGSSILPETKCDLPWGAVPMGSVSENFSRPLTRRSSPLKVQHSSASSFHRQSHSMRDDLQQLPQGIEEEHLQDKSGLIDSGILESSDSAYGGLSIGWKGTEEVVQVKKGSYQGRRRVGWADIDSSSVQACQRRWRLLQAFVWLAFVKRSGHYVMKTPGLAVQKDQRVCCFYLK